MKERKKRRRKFKKLTVQRCVIILLLCYLWFSGIHTSQLATEKNTYVCKTQIISAEIYNPPGSRFYDEIHLKTKDNCYVIVIDSYRENELEKILYDICSESQPLVMTVWKHFPSTLFNEVGGEVQVYQPLPKACLWIVYECSHMRVRAQRLRTYHAGVYLQ